MHHQTRPGSRMLMAAMSNSNERGETNVDNLTSFNGLILAFASMLCLVLLVMLCVCKKKKLKPSKDLPSQEDDRASHIIPMEIIERKPSQSGTTSVENGGSQSNRNSANMSRHSRQPSSASGNNVRPTSLRELPEPPVGVHHSRNTSMSGVPAVSGLGPCDEETAPKIALSENESNPDGDGYDHLGAKAVVAPPTDYDQLGPAVITPDLDTPVSEASTGMDGHYSLLKERLYAVCKDVRPKSIPVDNSPEKEDVANHYSHVMEEDPYNHINDSGGTLRNSVINRIRQKDLDDPYATVQEGSNGSYKAAMHAVAGNTTQSPHQTSPSSPLESNTVEDEYAVVQKVGGGRINFPEEENINSEDEISPYSIRPTEPPRLYERYEEEDHFYEDGSDQTVSSKEHKYSKVTARESLASMSARNALNTYEMVPDMPENTYATVEGGSGDGVVQEVVLRNRIPGMTEDENRLSQNSDTYAEIAISGGGLTTSVISNTSTCSNTNTTILGTSSGSSGAPIPPSLDSLPQMSKSLTSSEGDRLSDRLSDRFLGSPDERVLPGHFDDLDFSDNDGEDGYSTLTRGDGVNDSGRVGTGMNSHIHANGHDNSEDSGTDPNYESVDELRAKVAVLKAKDESEVGLLASPQISVSNVTGKDKLVDTKQIESDKSGHGTEAEMSRWRRPRHDYEEVDVSPPLSPPTSLPHSLESDTSHAEAAVRERVLNGHTYEEVSQVQAKKGQIKKASTMDGKKKSSSGEEKDKKKSKSEEKKKSKTEDKKKSNESKGGNSWDGSKKSNSWEANRTRL